MAFKMTLLTNSIKSINKHGKCSKYANSYCSIDRNHYSIKFTAAATDGGGTFPADV